MTHSILMRAQPLALTGAVLATLVLVASRGPQASVDPGSCRAAAAGTSAATFVSLGSPDDCSSGTSPIGYRLP